LSNLGYFVVSFDAETKVTEIVLNRPQQLQVLDNQFFAELSFILDMLNKPENETRVIIIWSQGKVFTAGLDLKALGNIAQTDSSSKYESSMNVYRHLTTWQKTISKLERITKPVIVCIHSNCIGGGVDLISSCDIRLSTKDALFSIKETRLGMVADLGTLQRIQKITSKGFAREMAFSGSPISADRALRFGLVNEVYSDQSSMLIGARELARDIASNSLLAIQGTKIALNYADDHNLKDSLNQIALWNSAFLQSDDLMEAVMSYMQKRKPIFRNKL